MLRYLWLAAVVTLGGCYSVDDLKERPLAWSASYSVPFDNMANCLAVRSADAYIATPQLYQREERAAVLLSMAGLYGPVIVGEYDIRTTSPSTIALSYRQRPSLIGDTKPARERADRCGAGA